MSEADNQKKLDYLSAKGRESFWFFCYYILGTSLGFDLIEENPHKWMCDIAQTWNKKKRLILLPRDTFKTTVLVVAQSLWLTVRNPEVSILLSSDKALNSMLSLSAIKDVLEKHPLFRACYGDLESDKDWTARQITIRTRTGNKRSPTIMCTGADSEKVGMHFDYIFFDDPHNRKNISTPEQILKIIDYYKQLHPILDTLTGRLQITATRWHHQDVNNHILTHESGKYDIYIKPAIWTDEVTGEEKLFYPARLTKEFLAERKEEMGTYLFSAQYQNNPTDDENAIFKRSYLKSFTISPDSIYVPQKDGLNEIRIPRATMTFFALCDPSGRGNLTESRRLDYTGIIVLAVDHRRNWYVFEAERKRNMTPSDIIERLCQLHFKYQPEVIGIEAITYQGQIKIGLEREFERRGIYQSVRDLDHKGREKGQRIRGLEPLYRGGKIYHAAGLYDLEMELLSWSPNSTVHDDLIDPLAYARDIAYTPDHEEMEIVEGLNDIHNPTYLMDADMAWSREGKRGSFADFLSTFDQREELEYQREAEKEMAELAARMQ